MTSEDCPGTGALCGKPDMGFRKSDKIQCGELLEVYS